jgi:hypothetical protein
MRFLLDENLSPSVCARLRGALQAIVQEVIHAADGNPPPL